MRAHFVLALLCLGSALAAQETLKQIDYPVASARFGRSLDVLGDIDGDGVPELVVGTDLGNVEIRSGVGNHLLRDHIMPVGVSLGFRVLCPGDLDLDQVEDYILSAPELGTVGMGFVQAYSGATGALLYQRNGQAVQDKFGATLALVGDVDFDAVNDFAVGAPNAQNFGSDVGRVQVFSGRTGALLGTFDGTAPNDLFGTAIAGPGDMTGDGWPDLLVGSPGANPDPSQFLAGPGSVRLFDLQTQSQVFLQYGDQANDGYGSSVCGIGDINGDGLADFALGIPGHDGLTSLNVGRVRVQLSDQTFVYDLNGTEAQARFGEVLQFAGDIDESAFNSFAIGTPNSSALVPGGGRIDWVHGASAITALTLRGDVVFGRLGDTIAPGRDWNSDGVFEIAFATPGAPSPLLAAGRVELKSFRPFLGPSADADTSSSGGTAFDLLRWNGSDGGSERVVTITGGQSSIFTVDAPPGVMAPAFSVFGAFALPRLDDAIELPFGLGIMSFAPCPLFPSLEPWLFTLTDGIFGAGCTPLVPAQLAPASWPIGGLPSGLRITLQGFVLDAMGIPVKTNALAIVVE